MIVHMTREIAQSVNLVLDYVVFQWSKDDWDRMYATGTKKNLIKVTNELTEQLKGKAKHE